MFEGIQAAPQDPILGLTEAFRKDPAPWKINLSIGVYKDGDGNTPVLHSVKQAEERILRQESSKDYLSIHGSAAYGKAVQSFLFGPDHEILKSKRAETAHTPGGTGALRVAGDFLRKLFPHARIWLSDPTWPNHPGVFRAAGLEIHTYPYYDSEAKGLQFRQMIECLRTIPAGDAVLFHASCHNPTGIDPTLEQWAEIADVAAKQRFLPLFDYAYQGLGDGIEEDSAGLLHFCRPGRELLVASSFSKNFGLYNERVGALTLVATDEANVQSAFSHIKTCIRANYSNPPAHGGAIVTTVLNDPKLRAEWEVELRVMRDRINGMRRLFVETLKANGAKGDFSFLTRQRGMFSYSGLTKEQVLRLREKYGVYLVDSGRINVAGMTEANMDALCNAIATVLK
ncbi:MAG: aspartate/tyrosine/aromatic aminotransferase [Candidatus Hydrogenedentes bacterium]|nr:aspartate/tyrosine/aromatic aminotransferase [Candidatus Hydrogenedentota bacterium]